MNHVLYAVVLHCSITLWLSSACSCSPCIKKLSANSIQSTYWQTEGRTSCMMTMISHHLRIHWLWLLSGVTCITVYCWKIHKGRWKGSMASHSLMSRAQIQIPIITIRHLQEVWIWSRLPSPYTSCSTSVMWRCAFYRYDWLAAWTCFLWTAWTGRKKIGRTSSWFHSWMVSIWIYNSWRRSSMVGTCRVGACWVTTIGTYASHFSIGGSFLDA